MTQRGRLTGTLFAAENYVLYVGPLVATSLHAHHAAQILVAPSGVSVTDAEGSNVSSFAVIAPRTLHGHGACEHAAVLFLDGDSTASRRLERSAPLSHKRWSRTELEFRFPPNPDRDTARQLVAEIARALELDLRPAPRHPAVQRMCQLLDETQHPNLAALSLRAGLSARQMRHAFLRDVGLSLRAYLRWLRLRRSVEVIEAGGNLTTAAAEAGFADSAHLTRVFRAHFGISPTQALGSVTWCALPRSGPLEELAPRGR